MSRADGLGEREPTAGPQFRMVGWWEASAPGTPATMAVFAADAADVSHMPPVPAYGEPTFACDLALLFRAHCGKPTPALFAPSRSGFRSSTAADSLAATVAGPASLSPAAAAPALCGAAARFPAFLVSVLHPTTASARLRTAAGGALAIRLFGVHARSLARGASPSAFRFSDGESALPVASTRV